MSFGKLTSESMDIIRARLCAAAHTWMHETKQLLGLRLANANTSKRVMRKAFLPKECSSELNSRMKSTPSGTPPILAVERCFWKHSDQPHIKVVK
jgi:hypothetical protein